MRITGGWEERRLADACEYARLTTTQTQAARLAWQGASFREIADALGLPYPAARRATLAASRKLRRAHPHAISADRAWLRDLFECLRNVCPPASRNELVYRPLPGGGYERRPVSMRPRPEGEVPEDLQLCPLRLLRELPRLLAQCAVSP